MSTVGDLTINDLGKVVTLTFHDRGAITGYLAGINAAADLITERSFVDDSVSYALGLVTYRLTLLAGGRPVEFDLRPDALAEVTR